MRRFAMLSGQSAITAAFGRRLAPHIFQLSKNPRLPFDISNWRFEILPPTGAPNLS
jgi:hypothetical protein